MKGRKSKSITIRIDESLHEELTEISEKEDRSLGSLCRLIIIEYVDKIKRRDRVEVL